MIDLLKVACGIFVIWGIFTMPLPKQEHKNPYKVVGKYNRCNVVRFESGEFPKYVYLMECKK